MGRFGGSFVLVYLRCDGVSGPDGLVLGGGVGPGFGFGLAPGVSGPDGLVLGGGVGRGLGLGLACPVLLVRDIAGDGLLVRSGFL